MMTDWVRQVLDRYGQEITLRRGETETAIRAFLQPVTEKREQVPDTATALGWIDGRQWLYLGQEPLETGDTLTWKDVTFRVRSCRPYYIGEALSHYWAALEKEREAAV